MDQHADYQVVAAASNPSQFGADADLILRYNYTRGGLWMKYTRWENSSGAKAIFTKMDEAIRAADDATRLQLTHEYLDLVAEQCVLYPVTHNETITAWDPKKLSGIKALPSPGINLLQAKRA
jgi:peptide/nickel transport system substrate-binding protein